jgi:hypothetical protein
MFFPRQELQLKQYMIIKQPQLMGYMDESIDEKKIHKNWNQQKLYSLISSCGELG